MIHVVDFEKTAFSTAFRGVLPPFGPQISAESGKATQSLAPGKPGWPPTSTWPLFSRPTPHASRSTTPRTSGVRSCADPSPLATAIHRLPDWQRPNGARPRRSASLYSVCHRIGRFLRTDQTFPPHTPPPSRGAEGTTHFLAQRRRSWPHASSTLPRGNGGGLRGTGTGGNDMGLNSGPRTRHPESGPVSESQNRPHSSLACSQLDSPILSPLEDT